MKKLFDFSGLGETLFHVSLNRNLYPDKRENLTSGAEATANRIAGKPDGMDYLLPHDLVDTADFRTINEQTEDHIMDSFLPKDPFDPFG